MADGLAIINEGLSGTTLEQAYSDRMKDSYEDASGVSIGVGSWTSDEPAISGRTEHSISDSQESVPVDAWHDYVENEVTVVSKITGGIVSGSDVGTFNYSLMEDGQGNVQAVAPVAVPVDVAYVAIGKALGVSMKISEMSPTLGGKLSAALVDAGVVYDKAKNLVTAWVDKLGNVLFPKDAIDAIAGVFDDENIPYADFPATEGTATSELDTGWFTQPIAIGAPSLQYEDATFKSVLETNAGTSATIFRSGRYLSFLTAAAESYEFHYQRRRIRKSDQSESIVGANDPSLDASYTYDGKTVYYKRWGVYEPGQYPYEVSPTISATPSSTSSTYDGPAAWTMVYGTIDQGGEYPDGTSESDAPQYTTGDIPIAGGIATSPEDTIPVVPINLPEDATDTTESAVDPISTTDDEVIGDLPDSPIPLPIPDTNVTNPDVPLADPTIVDSTLVDALVEELADTLDPQPGQSSGVIPIPPLPGILDPITGESSYPTIVPASGSGFIHVYNPTPAEFVSFGNWLWVTYADATIDKIWNNPFDGIIGAHELYATPSTDGTDNIRSGFLVCPTTAALVRQRYTEIDCGTVIVPEFYGNYLDYSPYSQCYIYLPFIGINEVSIDDIAGHAINIRYRIDAYNGSCIAMIFVAKDGYQNLCYQFAGNCAVEVPLAGGSQAAIKAGVMQAEAYARSAMISAGANLFGGIGSALMGNLGGVLSSIGGIASAYGNAQAGMEAARVANKSSVQHSGQFGASHGAMGEKIPFIIVRNPIQVKVVNYNEDYGFPAHKRVIVGGCRGYLRVKEVNVISAHATNEEKMAIELALKNGVYVS